jgi:hypothetical protein
MLICRGRDKCDAWGCNIPWWQKCLLPLQLPCTVHVVVLNIINIRYLHQQRREDPTNFNQSVNVFTD